MRGRAAGEAGMGAGVEARAAVAIFAAAADAPGCVTLTRGGPHAPRARVAGSPHWLRAAAPFPARPLGVS